MAVWLLAGSTDSPHNRRIGHVMPPIAELSDNSATNVGS